MARIIDGAQGSSKKLQLVKKINVLCNMANIYKKHEEQKFLVLINIKTLLL